MERLTTSAALSKLETYSRHVKSMQQTKFWSQCVRDADGSWANYSGLKSRYGITYFYGRQSEIDYDNPIERRYIERSLALRRKFYVFLDQLDEHQSWTDFKKWLETTHQDYMYRPSTNKDTADRSTTAHTPIITQIVIPIATSYQDPYSTKQTQGPIFDNIPAAGLPKDLPENDRIRHFYPSLKYSDMYFAQAFRLLKDIIYHSSDKAESLRLTAQFFQLLVNLHYFDEVNSSFYMNMANGLLECIGLDGIQHGAIDFVALRVQPATFSQYFSDQVHSGQKNRRSS